MAAGDPSTVLRAELNAAQAVLVPQIRGLIALADMSRSPAATQLIVDELRVRQRRLNRIIVLLAALDNVVTQLNLLYADGYPNFAPPLGAQKVIAEIQSDDADLQAAANIFESGPIAIGLDLTSIIHTKQPIPIS